MDPRCLKLLLLDDRLAICRLDADDDPPGWAARGRFSSITRTADEISVVCPEGAVPDGVRAVKGWRVFRVAGSMDFSVVGVLAALTTPLAEAGVGLFAVSTFDTDYLLVQQADLERAVAALTAAGHDLPRPASAGDSASPALAAGD